MPKFKVAILCSAGIGDALMSTPLIPHLLKVNPELHIDVITNFRLKNIFINNSLIKNVILFDKSDFFNLILTYFKLRKNKYGIIFGSQPSNTLGDAFISSTSKVNIKIDKLKKSSLEKKINNLYTYVVPDSPSKHRIELNLDMLRLFGFDIKANNTAINLKVRDIPLKSILLKYSNDFNPDEKYICVHPGSGGEYKRWDVNNFVTLIEYLNKKNKIILIGGKEEVNLSNYFENKGNVTDLIGKLDIEETYNILKHSEYFICNDSGLMHLACAVNIPLIALFGPTNPKHIGPYSRNAIVIKKDALKDISVAEVLNEVEKISSYKFENSVDMR